MRRVLLGTFRHTLRALAYGVVGGGIVAIVAAVLLLDSRPDLDLWHEAELDEEFRADSDVETFRDYLALEDRLFAQLEREIYEPLGTAAGHAFSRYHSGALPDPRRWSPNWNRSFELRHAEPRAAVLLLHGMSDSPYSMRSLAKRVHREGAYAVAMRVPGHGTAPSGLLDVEWEDMAAAVRIAAQHAAEQAPDTPLVIIGYSNGGALAVHYALESLRDRALPRPAQLVLLSPEIGITRLAALAVWQERLGHLLGLEKLAWNSIQPEYDPFKYGSFALNAGKQAYRITMAIQKQIGELSSTGQLEDFPPTLAFQSVVDATVQASVLVSGLFDRLPAGGHEIMLFDINRYTKIETVMKSDPASWLESVLGDRSRNYTISAIANVSPATLEVQLRRRDPNTTRVTTQPLAGLRWPPHIFSLSHVALPFAPDDPVYGGPLAGPSPGIQLGDLAIRGEKGVALVSATDMLRLRWNPFYPYLEDRTVEAMRNAQRPPSAPLHD